MYWKMLWEQTRAIVNMKGIPCRCGDKFKIPSPFGRLFQCYFCGEYFCKKCGKAHFGRIDAVFADGDGI